MRASGLLLAFALALGGCKDAASDEHDAARSLTDSVSSIGVDELIAMMGDAEQGKLALAIFDANVESYWRSRHIPGARWVESSSVAARDLPDDKATTLVFYCESKS